jgi:putative transposase
MKNDPQYHQRRSIRLKDYDYSLPGAYFVTLVTLQRAELFGSIREGEMDLSTAGEAVMEVWRCLPGRYPQVETGAAVVMPNHFHGIVVIGSVVGAIHELPLQQTQQMERRRMTLPLVVGYLKMNSAKRVNEMMGTQGTPVWQRNYYEHIIRNEEEQQRISQYIELNPMRWNEDEENRAREA